MTEQTPLDEYVIDNIKDASEGQILAWMGQQYVRAQHEAADRLEALLQGEG